MPIYSHVLQSCQQHLRQILLSHHKESIVPNLRSADAMNHKTPVTFMKIITKFSYLSSCLAVYSNACLCNTIVGSVYL